MALSEDVVELAKGRNFATLTTMLADGHPATQVMWVDCDDECVIINTEVHRQKFKNVERDPRVTVCIWEQDNPYRYVEVRGEVVEIVRGQRARDHIDECAQLYFGRPYNPEIIKSERVMLRIKPLADL
ncbi:MAG: pyridoxamine 5'-phosphate oxidase family protein [Nitriliruptoraceae bacterium]